MDTPFSYSAADNVWFVDVFAGARFSDERTIADAFQQCRRYWDAHIGRRCYTIVDYTGTVVDKRFADSFAAHRKTIVADCTITTVRYTSDLLARTAIRAMSIKLHEPSNLYASREEAEAVVRRLQAGSLSVGAGDTA